MTKQFQGSWCVFFILLFCGIIPAIIYYALMYKEGTSIFVAPQQQQQQQQVIIVQQPATPQPTTQQKTFCSECGNEVIGKYCNNCGAEIKP